MKLSPAMPDLDTLDLLVSVAELGSLGAAARRHGISQPAASMRLSALERRLGLRLLDRGPTGSALTGAGKAVVEESRTMLAAATDFVDRVAALRSADPPKLRLAASKTIADHCIPLWLDALRRARPDVAVTLEVENSQQVGQLVRSGRADVGFVECPGAPADLGNQVVGVDELVVVVGQAHPWARRHRPTTLTELAATPLLWREPGSGTRATVWSTLEPHGPIAAPAAELGSAAAISAAARSGAAPAVVSRLVADPDLDNGRLRAIAIAPAGAFVRNLRAIWRRGTPPSGAAELLVRIATLTAPQSSR